MTQRAKTAVSSAGAHPSSAIRQRIDSKLKVPVKLGVCTAGRMSNSVSKGVSATVTTPSTTTRPEKLPNAADPVANQAPCLLCRSGNFAAGNASLQRNWRRNKSVAEDRGCSRVGESAWAVMVRLADISSAARPALFCVDWEMAASDVVDEDCT